MSNTEEANQSLPEEQPAAPQAEFSSQPDVVVTATKMEMLSGPLPPPDILKGYEDIIPGAATRILKMAERQSEHRMNLEKTIVDSDSKMGLLGLTAAFLLSAMIIVGSVYVIANGYAWAGVSMIGINVASLAGVFVYGSKTRRTSEGNNNPPT